MTDLPADYPYQRSWGLSDHPIERYLALVGNWERSRNNCRQLSQTLQHAGLDDRVRCVAAAGSLGRMEASQESDADLIVVLNETVPQDSPEAMLLFESVWTALQGSQVAPPKPKGVFSAPCTFNQICDNSLGRADEPLGVFGKRLLLLLETQPIYRGSEYELIIDGIVKQYARHLRCK